ncbi:hypothetical protein DET54_102417 [Paenibacillus pabuli]|uniref:Uncharacterized protein n=1 Tax=Paenibacillus pabuli TaxID=1472 RepID=A0ABX9BQ92_9BACL|nr:GNAT family N-acetyltransferase [Paenibacillus pabuli]RAJ00930.1 hypothetical protein DET54_102417 [Paenibacillus pabuli]
MNDQLVLSNPSIELKDSYLSFYQEWKQSGEDMVPWVIEKDPENFEDMITWLNNNKQGININGFVANSTYWLVANQMVVGAVNIRHELTDKLFHSGGHIGYRIRPSKKIFKLRLLTGALICGDGLRREITANNSFGVREYRNVIRQTQMIREPFGSQLEDIFNSLCN